MSEFTNELQNKKQRLGRGLGSLLGGDSQTTSTPQSGLQGSTPAEARVWDIAIDKLSPSHLQPRRQFDRQALEELAQSIRENGILQPITARKNSVGNLEIIAGERRWRAAQIAGLHEVPVILKTMGDKETLELAIIENIQREDLNPIEEAEAYNQLMNEFHLTQQQVAERVGKDRVTVTNMLRLLGLPAAVIDLVKNGQLSQGHAKVLLSITDREKIISLAKKCVSQQLSVRRLEKETQEKQKSTVSHSPQVSQSLFALSEDLQKSLGTKVEIDYKKGKGKISIQFYSDDELTEICERIKAGCKK
jgi:ParB family transcriptional regulator, chromosome partitioning protein